MAARIVLVDDHPLILDALRRWVSRDFEIIGEAVAGQAALDMVRRSPPDLCVVDLTLADGITGWDLLRVFRRELPDLRLIVHTAKDDRATLLESFREGAWGFIAKATSPHDLLRVLASVRDGERAVSANYPNGLPRPTLPSRESDPFDLLTDAERGVVRLLASGLSTKSIAAERGTSPRTVDVQILRIRQKFHAPTREDLIRSILERPDYKL